MTKNFIKNSNGKIEFTENELKSLLDEVYNKGYNDHNTLNTWTWNSPFNWNDYLNNYLATTDGGKSDNYKAVMCNNDYITTANATE